MGSTVPAPLDTWEIHGFRTMADLDIRNMMEEAQTRWLRPNEIHAILCNHTYFRISVKPVNLPKSGKIVLFDRKMLRNFRKDGHNWKKKKDGKTVKEAHEHLKVGNEERIHVYYAHGEDKPTFVRRCYWLLDKTLEHIVLVHYRETQEFQGSPITPLDSNSSSGISDPYARLLSEESDSAVDQAYYISTRTHLEPNDSMTVKNHEMRLHEINTLEWDELLVSDDPNKLVAHEEGKFSFFEQQNQYDINGYGSNKAGGQMNSNFQRKDSELLTVGADSLVNLVKDGLQTEDTVGRWMNYIMTDSPGSVDDPIVESSISTGHESFNSPLMDHYQSYAADKIFNITDISPASALSTEETKIVVIGYFYEGQPHLAESNLFCVCGDFCVPVEVVQSGVFRCMISPQSPGLVNLFLSLDGHKPISQVVTFEYRAPSMHSWMISSDDRCDWDEFRFKIRLSHLLFSASKGLNILSGKVSQKALKEAKTFVQRTSQAVDGWENLIKSIEDKTTSFPQAKDCLFELHLQNRLQEWLTERIVEGSKITARDQLGQGVIHLCAILGYTWAVYPYAWSGLPLDYRDKFGWTALHWAAYYGREKMVAGLLSAGAKPNLVTDPTAENPGGCTAADLAFKQGYDGLAAYLAEKGLVKHFEDMTLSGNASGELQTSTETSVDPENFSEELYLKDTLAAYRTAADAAAHIQAAFRERSFKLRTKAVHFSNPENEVRTIVAAMKIQHAFRNYETRKMMSAAARIQYRFRTWKMRREFISMRRHAIKIQAVFRGFQCRKQYRKIIWSVGVLEKVVLRWRLKRKGLRGLQVNNPREDVEDQKTESDVEEDFFRASRKQAEQRVERSVVRVQAMFRSKRAQEEYQRMKLEHNKATLEYEGLLNSDFRMG